MSYVDDNRASSLRYRYRLCRTATTSAAGTTDIMACTRRGLHPQQGIAVAPILFVVALLAILATAIAAGSSTFSAGTDQEKARTFASAIIDDGINVRQAVMRVMALGCTETQLNFYDIPYGGTNGNNASAPGDKHCNIFDPAGGGLVYTPLLPAMCSPAGCTARSASGANVVPGVGTANPDLIWMAYYIDTPICDQINALLGRVTDTGTSAVKWQWIRGHIHDSADLLRLLRRRPGRLPEASQRRDQHFLYGCVAALSSASSCFSARRHSCFGRSHPAC